MFKSYKVIAVTPAGRRQYLELLIPYIINNPLIDEYHLWVNTNAASDMEYLRSIKDVSHKIRLIETSGDVADGPHKGRSINRFFKLCVDPSAIYIRFDDDIVYVDPDTVEKMLEYRLANRNPLLVYPMIVNNPVCSLLLSSTKKLEPIFIQHPHMRASSLEFLRRYWLSPEFAMLLHRHFLYLLERGQEKTLSGAPCYASLTRTSINCFAFFGSDMLTMGGVPLDEDEEEYLAVVAPTMFRRENVIVADALVAHYAFYTQRDFLDTTDILSRYRDIARRTFADFYERHPVLSYDRDRHAQSLDALTVAGIGLMHFDKIDFPGLPVQLLPDGRIANPLHDNETFWRLDGNALCLIHRDGATVTSRLEFVEGRQDNEPYVFAGPFLGSPEGDSEHIGRTHIMVLQR